jgi:hypothetical protein
VKRALPVGLAVAFSLVEGFWPQQSAAAHWSVGAVILLGLGAAIVLGRGRQHSRSGAWARSSLRAVRHWWAHPIRSASVALWVLVLGATVGWDAYSFSHQSDRLPTLSRVFGGVTRYPLGRASVFLLWLGLGAVLVFSERRTDP